MERTFVCVLLMMKNHRTKLLTRYYYLQCLTNILLKVGSLNHLSSEIYVPCGVKQVTGTKFRRLINRYIKRFVANVAESGCIKADTNSLP